MKPSKRKRRIQAINIVLEAKHDNTGAIQTFPGIVLSEPSYVNLFKSLTE